MKIATFGSCLSRYTANHFVKLFGGKIVSSVYHNRSDAFVNRFIDKIWTDDEYEDLLLQLNNNFSEGVDADNIPINILKNQYSEWMGKHRLSRGTPFLDALDSQKLDLILVDNYMDLAAKLVFDSKGHGYFLKLGDLSPATQEWSVGDYLSPAEGVVAMTKIINFFRMKSPSSKIVFTNFPHNTYFESTLRVDRTKDYERLFEYPEINVIPCLDIHEVFQTKQRQHFASQQYCAYAGIVRGLLSAI